MQFFPVLTVFLPDEKVISTRQGCHPEFSGAIRKPAGKQSITNKDRFFVLPLKFGRTEYHFNGFLSLFKDASIFALLYTILNPAYAAL